MDLVSSLGLENTGIGSYYVATWGYHGGSHYRSGLATLPSVGAVP